MELVLSKSPKHGMCPVKWCRRCSGTRKRLCDRHHQLWWRIRHPVKAAYAAVRHSARKRGKVFALTFAEFVDANSYIDGKGITRQALHIDRIDDRRGYEPDNIQILTCSENVAKENRRRFVKHFQQPGECPF